MEEEISKFFSPCPQVKLLAVYDPRTTRAKVGRICTTGCLRARPGDIFLVTAESGR